MSIRILGQVVITDRSSQIVPIAGHKARALLALLAIRPNRVVPVEQLEDELWRGTPSTGARPTLHAHISRLRATLRKADANAALVTSGCGYQLTISPDELDSARFEMLASAGAEAASASPNTAVSRLARSLEEWRGSALQGLHDYEPLFLEAQRLEELRLTAVEERWAAELELGGHLLAIGQLQRLVVDHPFRERLQGLLMLALHRSGRQTEALRAYQVAVNVLAEVGVAPGPELRTLEQRIATQAPSHDLTRSPVTAAADEGAMVGHAWNDALGNPPSVLVVDHDHRPTALDLLTRCARASDAVVLDGGSRIDEERRPNVVVESGHHAMKAVAALNAAVEHSARAGDEALARLGYMEAIAHYRLALGMLDLCGPNQLRRRTELLLACGRACHLAYELTEALTMFRLAARSAESIGDIALLNEAASGLAFATEFAMADSETVDLLARALRTVPSDSARRVELLAGLARTMPQDDRRSRSHAATAVALARRLGDPRALTIALATRVLVSWDPGDALARLTMIDEAIALGEELAWVDIVVEARNWRAATLLQLGRDVDAAADTARVDEWAHQSGRPFFVALAAMRHIGTLLDQGRLDEAETELSNPAIGAHSSPNFSEAAAAQLFLLRLAQGRVAELLALIESFLEDGQAPFTWRAAHVLALVHTGDQRSVDALHTQVAALRTAPRNWLWLTAVTLLTDACIALGDRDCAPILESALRNHRGETVVVAHGIASLGPITPRLDALRRLLTLARPDHKESASVS